MNTKALDQEKLSVLGGCARDVAKTEKRSKWLIDVMADFNGTGVVQNLEKAYEALAEADAHFREALRKIMDDAPSSIIDIWGKNVVEALESDKLPDDLGEPFAILAVSPKTAAKILTPGRLELLSFLAGGTVNTISELAKMADRPLSVVSRELKILENFGYIRLEKEGRKKKPILTTNRISIELGERP